MATAERETSKKIQCFPPKSTFEVLTWGLGLNRRQDVSIVKLNLIWSGCGPAHQ